MSHYLTIQKTARYEISGEIDQAELIVIALHGYGQLVPYFIQKFNGLDKKIAVIAPEGLHRFYLSGSSGRVGASWMTKEERKQDIQDNINYLNSLFFSLKLDLKTTKLALLGFSQGGATAVRWYANNPGLFDHVIIWASIFPPDVEFPTLQLSKGKHFFFVGDKDPFYSITEVNAQRELYDSKGFHVIHYAGGHEIQTEQLNTLLKELIQTD